MQKIETVSGRPIPLPLDDIDTDRIIPARYLRCVTFDGLGEHAFEDDRKQDSKHPFDNPQFQGASILVVGRNFGCGSSREHAPQALMRWGIKALVGESFAEIFFGNCTANGIPCVCVSHEAIQGLTNAALRNPDSKVIVDLVSLEVRAAELRYPCTILDSARKSLITGQWDFLAQLVEAEQEIKSTAQQLPYLTGFNA